jgi:class 3 adenylate cyclase
LLSDALSAALALAYPNRIGHYSWVGAVSGLPALGGGAVSAPGVPVTEYARGVDGGQIAYQVIGEGPVDILVSRATYFPIDMMWEAPKLVRFLERLSLFARHVWFDPRGTGSSDRVDHEEGRLLETVVDDMVSVLDAVGWDRAVLLGLAVPIPLLFAATHPDRTMALVLADSTARMRTSDDYPDGLPDDDIDRYMAETVANTGDTVRLDRLAPSLANDAAFARWFERAFRLTCPPAERVWRMHGTFDTDLRQTLGAIRVPSLIINHVDRRQASGTRYLRDHIDGAKTVEVPGADYMPLAPDSIALLDAVEEFLTGRLPKVPFDRALATVLFTDIVNSTGLAATLGDLRWRELLDRHDSVVRGQVDRFRGAWIKSTGDGVLATFDGPARAIRCACAIRDAVQPLGLEIRAGLHCGEIELHHNDIAGITVHIGQRVASLAAPNQVLVSRTVVDLLAGSDITFVDRGDHELRGVPGTWCVYEVRVE